MTGFFGISWWIWGALATLIALIFAFFVPNRDAVMATTGINFFILRWVHSLVWIFLALSFFMRASENDLLTNWANPVAMLGGACYLVYLVTIVRSA